MPDESAIDGEVVAFDESGRPSFNALQNYGSSSGPLLYFVFDAMVVAGADLLDRPLEARRLILEKAGAREAGGSNPSISRARSQA